MANKVWLLFPLLLATGSIFADGGDGLGMNNGICKGHIESAEQCQWIEGSISIYNGTPSVRIRQHGSRRVYAVGPSEQELMPLDLKSKLTVDNVIEAKLKICPVSKQRQNGFRVVCVDEARAIKVSESG